MHTTEPDPPLRILLVDDHAIVREGLKRVLDATAAGWAVAEAGGGFEALDLARARAFDLAVVDLSMPGMNGLDFLRRVREQFPHMRVLVLSMHAEQAYAMRAFKAGASGYVTKDSAARELASAVRKVAAGGTYISAELAEQVVLQMNGGREPARHSLLSDRELDVLRRLANGQRPTDIARALHLSVKTVSTHKARILERLELPNLAALIRYGIEHSLIGADPVAADPG